MCQNSFSSNFAYCLFTLRKKHHSIMSTDQNAEACLLNHSVGARTVHEAATTSCSSNTSTSPQGPRVDGKQAYCVAIAVAVAQMCILGAYTSFPAYLSAMQADPTLGNPSLTTLSVPQSIVLGIIPTLRVVAGIACDPYPLLVPLQQVSHGLGLTVCARQNTGMSCWDGSNPQIRVQFKPG